MSTLLSEHFTLEEAIQSQVASREGIDNYPTSPMVITTASTTAVKLEKVRALLGHPINVDSWIRCLALNRALKSKDTSQHILGEAVDFICPQFGSPLEICQEIMKHMEVINFDQLILEHTWVHISFKSDPSVSDRNHVLSLLEDGTYANGLTDKTGKFYA